MKPLPTGVSELPVGECSRPNLIEAPNHDRNFSSDLQHFVQQELASGHYQDERELVLEAVRFYRDSNRRLEELRAEIKARRKSLDEGKGIELEDDAALEAFFDDIEAEVADELAGGKKPQG